jgi:hypothetical protein
MHIDRSFRFFSGISQYFWQELQQRSVRVPNSHQLLTGNPCGKLLGFLRHTTGGCFFKGFWWLTTLTSTTATGHGGANDELTKYVLSIGRCAK